MRQGFHARRCPPPRLWRARARSAGPFSDVSVRFRRRGARRNRGHRIGYGTERSPALPTRRRPTVDWSSAGWTAAGRGEGQQCQCQRADEPPEQKPDQRLSRATSREPPGQRCKDTGGQHDHNEEVVGHELYVDSGGNESGHPTRGALATAFGRLPGGHRHQWCPDAPEVAPCNRLTQCLEQVRKCKCQYGGLKYGGVQDLGGGLLDAVLGELADAWDPYTLRRRSRYGWGFFVLSRSCARCGHRGSQPCG